MAGLYIHIPFCRTKCAYCDFFSLPLSASVLKTGATPVMERYCRALLEEFDLRHMEIPETFSTVYIGGGTPTALPMGLLTSLIQQLLDKVGRHNHSVISEFTVEANPEDITVENLRRLANAGVNRISIGVQSFDSTQLCIVERFHDAATSLIALETLSSSGLNYSADLIYGLPGQTPADWQRQLNRLLTFRPPHFSAYLLSYEPGTRLYTRREAGVITEADEQTATEMYRILTHTARENGYRHYEISNFAKPGQEAIHNSSYWNLTPYLGLGCAAHSFDGKNRRANPCHLKRYTEAILAGKSAAQLEKETTINRVNDYIITSLRTTHGISTKIIQQHWGEKILMQLHRNSAPLIASGRITVEPQQQDLPGEHYVSLRIPEDLWLTSDAIIRDIILEEPQE